MTATPRICLGPAAENREEIARRRGRVLDAQQRSKATGGAEDGRVVSGAIPGTAFRSWALSCGACAESYGKHLLVTHTSRTHKERGVPRSAERVVPYFVRGNFRV